jgi:hypothetical protein
MSTVRFSMGQVKDRSKAHPFAGNSFPLLNGWRALMTVTLGLFVVSIPARYEQLEAVALEAQRRLGSRQGLGLLTPLSSPDLYPLLVVGLEVSFVAALLVSSAGIAVGRIDDWRNLFFSAVFITYSVWVTPTLDALEGGAFLRHFVSMVQAVGLIFAIHFFLLFPDGRFVPRWTRISSAFWIAYTFAWGVFPDAWFSLINPFDVPVVVFAALMFGWVTGLVAQTIRYRSYATPEQCKQVKWVLIAIASAVAGYGAVYLPGVFIADSGVSRIAFDLFSVPIFWLLAMPMAFALGVAMLRHQLFDFHAVVNRTLVYGSLTSALALIYYGMVGLLQQVLHPIAGTSSYAIVGSTITVSVMFRPARSRIQSVIDQRFYRKRYNAAQTLESFSMRLRDEIDLGTLEKELLAVVQGTMQPVQASLLLLQPTSGNPEHQVTSWEPR